MLWHSVGDDRASEQDLLAIRMKQRFRCFNLKEITRVIEPTALTRGHGLLSLAFRTLILEDTVIMYKVLVDPIHDGRK